MSVPRLVWLVAVVSGLLAGCIGGERLMGATISVRNDSGKPIVVRIWHAKFEVGRGDTRFLYPSYNIRPSNDQVVDILDPTSCAVVQTVTLTFEKGLDPLLTVPPSGPLTRTEQRPGDTPTAAVRESRNACPEPSDGWTISVGNPSTTIRRLIAYDEGGTALWQAKLSGDTTATIRLGGYQHESAGSIVLLGLGCKVLDRVDHAATGTYVIKVKSETMTIEPGPIPIDDPELPTTGEFVCPVTSPASSASPG
jgi:hypothetical protein